MMSVNYPILENFFFPSKFSNISEKFIPMNITNIHGAVSLSIGVAMPYFGLGVFGLKEG